MVTPRKLRPSMADDNRDKDVDNNGDYNDNHYKDVATYTMRSFVKSI